MKKLLVSTLLAGFFQTAWAVKDVYVNVPETVVVSEQQLVLNGAGVRKISAFLKLVATDVYVAALYVSQKTSNADEVTQATTPKRLTLHMVRDVNHKAMFRSFKDSP